MSYPRAPLPWWANPIFLIQLRITEELIEKTKQLSWHDISGLLKPNRHRANTIHQASLVGRLVSKKVYPSHIIQPRIMSGWRLASELKIEDAGPNRLVFTFAMSDEKDLILSQGPWNFKGSYMGLRESNPSQTIDEMSLFDVEFWVQIHSLPLEIVDEANARLIGNMLGTILELDDVDALHSFIRLKIRFPSSKPLELRFSYHCEDGGSVWVGFQYERLSSFCFHCDVLDHTIGACYQNPQHPLNYALTDKMRCFPPPVQSVEHRQGTGQGIRSKEGSQHPLPSTASLGFDGEREEAGFPP